MVASLHFATERDDRELRARRGGARGGGEPQGRRAVGNEGTRGLALLRRKEPEQQTAPDMKKNRRLNETFYDDDELNMNPDDDEMRNKNPPTPCLINMSPPTPCQ